MAVDARDVDEDRVEQLGELIRTDLQVVEVVAIVRDADVRHALRDPPLEARPLVAGEVEAARRLEEGQQLVEVAVQLTVWCHQAAVPDLSSVSSAPADLLKRAIASLTAAACASVARARVRKRSALGDSRRVARRSSRRMMSARSSRLCRAAHSAVSSARDCSLTRLSGEKPCPTRHSNHTRGPSSFSHSAPPHSGQVSPEGSPRGFEPGSYETSSGSGSPPNSVSFAAGFPFDSTTTGVSSISHRQRPMVSIGST